MSLNENIPGVLSRPFDTPYGVPPFGQFTDDDFAPAIEAGIEARRRAVEAICTNDAEPDFGNTIEALERCDTELDRVLGVFYPLLSALSTQRLMELSGDLLSAVSASSVEVMLDERLWRRVEHVYRTTDPASLEPDAARLLKSTYDRFARSGALLQGSDRERFKEITASLTDLTNRFGQNLLRANNTVTVGASADEVGGIAQYVLDEAAELAAKSGSGAAYMFSMHQPVYVEVMKHASDRALRERMWRAYMSRCVGGEHDNMAIIAEIVRLRAERARLLGRESHAHLVLEQTMAGTPEAVEGLLSSLSEAYAGPGHDEMTRLDEWAHSCPGALAAGEGLQPWDYSFFAESLRKHLFDYDVEQLRPYFMIDNVVEGVFGLATRLYGIRLEPRPGLPVYHPDVRAYEAVDSDGTSLGILYADFYPRDTKRPGAWMTEFRGQQRTASGEDVRPVVSLVMNFTKPTADRPSLLTPDEVRTLLHEFGHALHGLFSQVRYPSQAGTSVYRDFVELPSQFNENFLCQPEFLSTVARHYLTGEPLPASEVDKIVASQQFGAAYSCMRQLSFGLLDMRWHTMDFEEASGVTAADVERIERGAMAPVALLPTHAGAVMSPSFSHIFAGGYSAGYYSYKWSEVLDADAFAAFEERGVFDKEMAGSFRRGILQRGDTDDPAALYRRWRGRDPQIDALLRRDGIKA